MARIWLWLATRGASAWIAAVSIAAVASLLIYIQQLRVEAARCKGREDAQQIVDNLTDKVVEQIEDATETRVKALRKTPDDGCLDRAVPDSLRDDSED